MLGWSMMDLAEAAKVSISTIKRMENPEPQPISGHMQSMIHDVVRAAGVTFLADNGEGPGIRVLSVPSKP